MIYSLRSLARHLVVVFLTLFVLSAVQANTAELVKDINTQNDSLLPERLFVHNGLLYFVGDDEVNDGEVWISDGTIAGTKLLKDINPGNGDVDQDREVSFIGVGNTVFFNANNGFNGNELWKTDGTEQGTVLVKDLNPTFDSDGEPRTSQISNFTVLGTAGSGFTLIFAARDENSDYQLWQSDGTENGTTVIPGLDGETPDPAQVVRLNDNTVVFSGTHSVFGRELFSYTLGDPSIELVRDIFISPTGGSDPREMLAVDGVVYFSASNGTSQDALDFEFGRELWRTDGTQMGTFMVGDLNPVPGFSSNPHSLIAFNGEIYFAATTGLTGSAVYRTETTNIIPEGVMVDLVLAHNLGTGPTGTSPEDFVIANNELFFTAFGSSGKQALWKSNGTDDTDMQVNATELTPSSDNINIITSELFSNGSQVFFTADTDDVGGEPWVSNGTVNGTQRLADINPGDIGSAPEEYAFLGGQTFIGKFSDEEEFERELWVSDGTPLGTQQFGDFNTATNASRPQDLIDLDGTLFFTATNPDEGRELWKSDGTTAGTVLVKDIYPGSVGANISQLNAVNGLLYFNASSLDEGDNRFTNVYRSDGSLLGTTKLFDEPHQLVGGFGAMSLDGLTTLLIAERISDQNIALYQTDGTLAGTSMLVNLPDGFTNETPAVVIDDTAYFVSAFPGPLWKTDGTEAGTMEVSSLQRVNHLQELNGLLYFFADGANNTRELWVTDGSTIGTSLVKAGFTSREYPLLSIDDLLLFFASNDDDGLELWRSNGTPSGTVRVVDLVAGDNGLQLDDDDDDALFIATSKRVYFVADDGNVGLELWTSDGTANGTFLLKNIDGERRGSNVNDLLVVGDTLYFEANDRIHGEELWVTNGTSAGTNMLRDFLPGPGSSDPDNMLLIGNTIFMQLENGQSGDELFKFNIADDSLCVVIPTNNEKAITFCL